MTPSTGSQPPSSDAASPAPSFLAGGGKMAKLVHDKDWSQTPLGPIEQWPQSLRTTVSLCLASNFPINIAWGPQRVQIYNDGYWPLCGDKHPTSMGQDYKECWLSAWPVLGEAFEQASRGQARFLENQRMFLDRYGYLEETFFTFSFSPILDESGGVGGLFHPVTELTQQTLAERRLNALRTLAEHTANAHTVPEAVALILKALAIFNLDIPFALLYAHDLASAQAHLAGHTGATEASALATATMALDGATSWPLAAVASSGKVQRVEGLGAIFGDFVSGPYPEPPHTALVFPLYLPGGPDATQPAYFLVVGVSARRTLDVEYLLFYDLLAAAVGTALAKARTLEQERQRAEALAELDRAKTAFFSNISHEFRTPLTLMLGPLEDALTDARQPLPPAQHERLVLVQRNTLRLQRLVNGLLDFSRLEAGRLQAQYQPTDLGTYTTELASVFRAAMEKAGLAFTIDSPPTTEPVYVDQAMWEKIVFNLLSNALKFTFKGGITVQLREEAGQAVLHVRDTGEGIAPAELPRLFQRFHRIEGTRSRTVEGSGIGLALVQELVKLHGGTIGAESAPGQGTTFEVRLPMSTTHLPADRLLGAAPAELPAGQSTVFVEEAMQWLAPVALADAPKADTELGNALPATILVVDDNADMREYVQRILSQQAGWTIRVASDGQQALEAIEQQRPDLVLSDVMMPRLDGFGLVRALKAQPATAGLPVILLSARAGEEASVEGLAQGADDYLTKPFSARELLARIRTQLEITRTRQDNTALRAAEQQLNATNTQLRQLNNDLDNFVYTASHDLKAPIANIEGLLHALQRTLPPEVQQSADVTPLLAMMQDSVERFGRTIGHLTDISRLQKEHGTATELLNLTEIINEVCLDLEPLRQSVAGQIIIDVAACPAVRFSAKNLRSVVYNLLSNALKYHAPGQPARIEVRCVPTPGHHVLSVSDNGLGIGPENMGQLFTMFKRFHDHVEGSGIGLYMVKKMLDNAGGRIEVESQPGVGTTFRIYFLR